MRPFRRLSSIASSRPARMPSNSPVQDAIRDKITTALSPSSLVIRNDSHLHAHHAAMRGSSSTETHFHLTITSTAFQSKPQPARHRMVYALLKEEMSREGGIHALQLKTQTPEEEARATQTKAATQAS